MSVPTHAPDVLNKSFEEVAHTLGGFLAADRVAPASSWKLMGEVCGSWFRARARLEESEARSDQLHPSVAGFLAAIRATGSQRPRSTPGDPGADSCQG